MIIRLFSTAAVALTMLAPLASAQTAGAQQSPNLSCLQRDVGIKADCIDPTAASVDLAGAVTVSGSDVPRGDSDHGDTRTGAYTIIYKADPFLTINNNPK
jgi:hypothetical protein